MENDLFIKYFFSHIFTYESMLKILKLVPIDKIILDLFFPKSLSIYILLMNLAELSDQELQGFILNVFKKYDGNNNGTL